MASSLALKGLWEVLVGIWSWIVALIGRNNEDSRNVIHSTGSS